MSRLKFNGRLDAWDLLAIPAPLRECVEVSSNSRVAWVAAMKSARALGVQVCEAAGQTLPLQKARPRLLPQFRLIDPRGPRTHTPPSGVCLKVSMDFNHRKQLGPLAELWAVVKPELDHLQCIIFSVSVVARFCKTTMRTRACF